MPPSNSVLPEAYLLLESEKAHDLTVSLDSLRNSVSGYYLTFAGAASAAAAFLVQINPSLLAQNDAVHLAASLLGGASTLSLVVTAILARIRSTQLEYFRIINNVRALFAPLGSQAAVALELTTATLPKPRHTSGSYFWTLLSSLPGAALAGAATYLVVGERVAGAAYDWTDGDYVLAASIGLLVLVANDLIYFRLAKPRPAAEQTPPAAPAVVEATGGRVPRRAG